MKTLLSSQKPPLLLPLHFPKPSLSLYNPTQTHPTTTTTTWKLHANGKGFGGGGDITKESFTVNKNGSSSSNKKNDEDHLPQAVLDRIIARILASVLLPIATGIVLMNLLGWVKEQQLWDVPKWVLAVTAFSTFGASAVGLAYGPLSASWDEQRKGSLLGLEEAKQNWVVMWAEGEENDDG